MTDIIHRASFCWIKVSASPFNCFSKILDCPLKSFTVMHGRKVPHANNPILFTV